MKFKLSKKIVAVVRYYETMWLITDGKGERIYTGNDEKTAKHVLKVLNAFYLRKKVKPRRKRK